MPRSRQTRLPSRAPRTVLTCLVLMLASIACAANSRTAPSDCGTLAVCCATRTGAAEQALCNSTTGAADATACARLLSQLCPGSVDASFLADSSAKDGTRKDSGGVSHGDATGPRPDGGHAPDAERSDAAPPMPDAGCNAACNHGESCTNGGTCVCDTSCTGAYSCNAADRCVLGACAGGGQTCSSAGDCCDGIACTAGVCCSPPQGACTTGADCCGGLSCIDGACAAPPGGSCTSTSECGSGFDCVADVCCESSLAACTTAIDCCAGLTCEGRLCCSLPGGSCTTNSDCCAGSSCEGGTCGLPVGSGVHNLHRLRLGPRLRRGSIRHVRQRLPGLRRLLLLQPGTRYVHDHRGLLLAGDLPGRHVPAWPCRLRLLRSRRLRGEPPVLLDGHLLRSPSRELHGRRGLLRLLDGGWQRGAVSVGQLHGRTLRDLRPRRAPLPGHLADRSARVRRTTVRGRIALCGPSPDPSAFSRLSRGSSAAAVVRPGGRTNLARRVSSASALASAAPWSTRCRSPRSA